MPGPIASAWQWANKPLVGPSETVDKMAQPELNDSPAWARMKGFGSGALEGLRKQTSPLNLAGLASMAVPGVGLARGAEAAGEGAEAIQGLSRAIPGLNPRRYAPAMETLGETLPEFTPVGGEGMYNAGRQATQIPDVAAATKNVARTPFQTMKDTGAFTGDRSVRGVGNLQREQPGGLSEALQVLKRMR